MRARAGFEEDGTRVTYYGHESEKVSDDSEVNSACCTPEDWGSGPQCVCKLPGGREAASVPAEGGRDMGFLEQAGQLHLLK